MPLLKWARTFLKSAVMENNAMDNEDLLRKLRSIRDTLEDDPETAGEEMDSLIEELEENVDDRADAA
jgi:hypothetical protein